MPRMTRRLAVLTVVTVVTAIAVYLARNPVEVEVVLIEGGADDRDDDLEFLAADDEEIRDMTSEWWTDWTTDGDQ